MAHIPPELKSKLERDPQAIVNLIVRVKDKPQAHLDDLRALDVTVRRTFTLIPALAIQGRAAALLKLAKKSWVQSLEEDKVVHTMS
jgi:hypothetical protein